MDVFIVAFCYLLLSTFQLNMVRQRKDSDSLERVDGSKPTWKVCLDVQLFFLASHLHVLPVLVLVSNFCPTHAEIFHYCGRHKLSDH